MKKGKTVVRRMYLKEMLVVHHRVSIGNCSDLILQHLLMDTKVCVRVKIVVLGCHFIHSKVINSILLRSVQVQLDSCLSVHFHYIPDSVYEMRTKMNDKLIRLTLLLCEFCCG